MVREVWNRCVSMCVCFVLPLLSLNALCVGVFYNISEPPPAPTISKGRQNLSWNCIYIFYLLVLQMAHKFTNFFPLYAVKIMISQTKQLNANDQHRLDATTKYKHTPN